MNKKGFTIIELLGVIVIMAALLAIAVPAVLAIAERMKTNMYCTKLEVLENDARIYGEDNKGYLVDVGSDTYEKVKSYDTYSYITVGKLLEKGYIKSDDIEIDDGKVVDPRDNSESLNDYVIKVYKKNKRVYSKILDPDGKVIEDCK